MAEKEKQKFSRFFYNRITYVGVFLALLIFLIECFLFAVDFMRSGHDVYSAILAYLVLPPFLFLGLILIPLGAFWKQRQVRKGKTVAEPSPLRIDLSISKHVNALFVFLIGTFIVLLMSFVGSYKAYHYTESVEFCGLLCHSVMEPEYTTYVQSPHSRVSCAECHIGEGADWYVRSKLSGVRQVFRTALNTFDRPINTPIADLRPAQETCKQCHWPGKFFGSFDFKRVYYLTEGEQRKWFLRMLLNVGGGDHQSYGVHAHMNVNQDIYYVAEDSRRQEISWVKSVGKNGTATTYIAEDSRWKDAEPPEHLVRKMDCMDCHNRPSHKFEPPFRLLNEALQYGDIPDEIPNIKKKAMEVLSREYPTKEMAIATIAQELRTYYVERETTFYEFNKERVERAIEQVGQLYKENIFPEMKTRWDTHPDNIGHLHTEGCFRCHDGNHQSKGGDTITRDCKVCHTIVEQGPVSKITRDITGIDFKHPVDIGEAWKEMSCASCHTGGS